MNSVILEVPQSWNKYSYVLNRPLFANDPDGRCSWCVGALVGGLAEGGFTLGARLIQNHGHLSRDDWKAAGASFVGGAIAGALAVATGGASLVESEAVGDIFAGGATNVIGGVIARALDPTTKSDDVFSMGEISKDAIFGFADGLRGHLAGNSIHLPEEPIFVGPVSAKRIYARTPDGRFASLTGLVRQQVIRSGVAGAGTTHGTSFAWDWVRSLISPDPPKGPCVSTTDSAGGGGVTPCSQ